MLTLAALDGPQTHPQVHMVLYHAAFDTPARRPPPLLLPSRHDNSNPLSHLCTEMRLLQRLFGAAPGAWSSGRINKLQQALHENNTDQFNIDAKEWRA